MILGVFMGGALTLFAVRASAMEAKGLFAPVSREGALVANNVLLSVSSLVVFVGTIWPLVAEMFFDRKLSVGPPFFNMAFTPFVVALAALLPIGSMLPWKRGTLARTTQPLTGVLDPVDGAGGAGWAMQTGRSALGAIAVLLAAWVVFGALADLWQRGGRGGIAARLSRLTRLPRADWGKAVAHIGFGVTIFAVGAVTRLEDRGYPGGPGWRELRHRPL